jgi:uncharacterized protein YcbK (DUF882 family)
MTKPDFEQLTPNFHISEFIKPGTPQPNLLILYNILLVAQRLQAIRDILNRPIYIHSGYRTAEHNLTVGGKTHSFHLSGMAVDISIKGMSPKAVQTFLKNWSGGMGLYQTHLHLDIRPEKIRW